MSTYPIDPNRVIVQAAKAGAVIGATGAAAAQLKRMQHSDISWPQAAKATAKGAAQVSLAAAAASSVSSLFSNKAAALAAGLVTGTALMYILNQESGAATDE